MIEWGRNSYDHNTGWQGAGSGTGWVSASHTATGLESSAIYKYRIKAKNALGTTYGSEGNFTTPPKPEVIAGEDDNHGGPHVIAQPNGTVDVFYRTPGGGLGHNAYVNGNWGTPELSGTLAPGSVPHPVVQDDGTIDVFYRTPSGGLGHNAYVNGYWGKEVLPGSLASDPHPVVQDDGTIDIFYRTPSGGLGHTVYVGGYWSLDPLPGAVAGDPYPIVQEDGTIDVFYRTPSGGLGHNAYVDGYWGQPALPGSLAPDSDPHPVVQSNGTIDVFYRTPSGGLGHNAYVDGYWGTPELPGTLREGSDPHPVVQDNGTIDVFYRTPNDTLGHTVYVGGYWSLDPLPGSVGGEPYGVVQEDGTIDVFYRTPNDTLGHNAYVDGYWGQPTLPGSLDPDEGMGVHAVAQPNGTVDVLYRTPNGGIGHNAYALGNWGTPELPGQVYGSGRPEAATGVATDITHDAVTLHATVNPQEWATTYQFEYGTTTAYGSKAPATPESVGSGYSGVAVSSQIEDLEANTAYYYRVVASNANGTAKGSDKTFVTPDYARPNISNVSATRIGRDEATIGAMIDPRGFTTTYHVEWGTEAEHENGEYNNQVGAGELDGEAGKTAITTQIEGLQQWGTYYFRVVAENAEGERIGPVKHFTTAVAGIKAIEYPATATATPLGTMFVGFGGAAAYCSEKPTLEGTLEGGNGATDGADVLAMGAVSSWGGCTTLLGDIDFVTNGCKLELDPGYGGGPQFEGQVHIGPPGCGPITAELVSPTWCEISIPAQDGGAASFENQGEGFNRTVKVEVDWEGLRYEKDGELCQNGEFFDGILEGTWELDAEGKYHTYTYETSAWVTPFYEYGPLVLDQQVSDVTPTTATLHATIDALGTPFSARFEYGTPGGSFTASKKFSAGPNEPVEIEATLEGLQPNAEYQFRALAGHEEGYYPGDGVSTQGEKQAFTTSAAITKPASEIGWSQATLNGEANPPGAPTSYHFEWADQEEFEAEEYGHSVPVPDQAIGSGTEAVAVSQTIEGLTPKATYHYRVVASSEEGTAYGEDVSFEARPQHFQAGSYPAQVSASQSEVSFAIANKNFPLDCEATNYEGTLGAEGPQLSLGAEYKECTTPFGEATVQMNSCSYVLDVDNTDPYEGGVGVACTNAEDKIKILSAGCTLSLPPQSPAAGLGYANQGEGEGRTVALSGQAEGLHYTANYVCQLGGLPASGEGGKLGLGPTLAGEGTAFFVGPAEEAQVGVYLGGEESEEEAKQPHLEAELYPAQISASQSGVSFSVSGKNFPLDCEATNYEGTLGAEAPQLFLDAEYDECTAPFGEATVQMNSCSYVLDVDNTDPYEGGVGVACANEEDKIKILSGGCTLSLPPQSPAAGLGYANQGEGEGRTVAVTGQAEGLHYTANSICQLGGLPASGEGGKLGLGGSLHGRLGD